MKFLFLALIPPVCSIWQQILKYNGHLAKTPLRIFLMRTEKEEESIQFSIYRSTAMMEKSICQMSVNITNIPQVPDEFFMSHQDGKCSNTGEGINVIQ